MVRVTMLVGGATRSRGLVPVAALAGWILLAGSAGAEPEGLLTYEGDGRVVGIDRGAGTVTLEHAGITGLLSAGVIELPLRSPAVGQGIRVGDAVRFGLLADPRRQGLASVAWLDIRAPSPDTAPAAGIAPADLPRWLLALALGVLGGIAGGGLAAWRSLDRTRRGLLGSTEELRRTTALLAEALEQIVALLARRHPIELRRRINALTAAGEIGVHEAQAAQPPYLFVIRRGETDIYRSFREQLASPDIADVVWDQRGADRRSRSQPVAVERRRGERRRPPPGTWTVFGFVILRRDPAKS